MTAWPEVGSEEIPWGRDNEELMLVLKVRRRKIALAYCATIPFVLEGLSVRLASERVEYLTGIRVPFRPKSDRLSVSMPSLRATSP